MVGKIHPWIVELQSYKNRDIIDKCGMHVTEQNGWEQIILRASSKINVSLPCERLAFKIMLFQASECQQSEQCSIIVSSWFNHINTIDHFFLPCSCSVSARRQLCQVFPWDLFKSVMLPLLNLMQDVTGEKCSINHIVDAERAEGGGFNSWEINQWKLCQQPFSGVRWWENFPTLSGDIICEHTGVLQSQKF